MPRIRPFELGCVVFFWNDSGRSISTPPNCAKPMMGRTKMRLLCGYSGHFALGNKVSSLS